MTISTLYPALFKVWVEVLKPGGTVIVMTAENKTLSRALKLHEADMRKRNTGWLLAVESIQTSGIDSQPPNNMFKAEERLAKMRTVSCGYLVSVACLRKRPLID